MWTCGVECGVECGVDLADASLHLQVGSTDGISVDDLMKALKSI